MSKYIDADVALDIIDRIVELYPSELKEIKQAFLDTPAADVEPARHGKWKEHGAIHEYFWICSSCGFPSEALAAPELYKYCPHCGAKMDGGSEEDG